MAVLKAVVELTHVSGLPKDSSEQQFIFSTDHTYPYDASVTAINNFLLDFYNAPHGPASQTLASFISQSMSRVVSTSHIHFYDITTVLDGSPAGSPFHTSSFTLSTPTAATQELPAEVACVLSYHASYQTLPERGPNNTRPRQRKRGRIFIGPLNTSAVGTTIAGRVTVHQNFQETLAACAATLMGQPIADARWVQWSRVNRDYWLVVGGHIDDAFDTQRRRGEDADNRKLWGTQ